MNLSIEQHNKEIKKNLEVWNRKPLLRLIYEDFYDEILEWVRKDLRGKTVELGSGMGNFKGACPYCIITDIFPNPWIDMVETVYHLSFRNNSISNYILIDVFHHLAFPGSAFLEFERTLADKGRVIIFEPYVSLMGLVVYGIFHHEPVGLFKKINWLNNEENANKNYYAAQGNAARIFGKKSFIFGRNVYREEILKEWNIVNIKKLSALSYILSGGFSKPAFYPKKFMPILKCVEKFLDLFPLLFATRAIIILEKKGQLK
jgi:SAM-dependent methyltransferase